MLWLLQILSILELLFHVFAESNIMLERWVNASDVIKVVPFTTMTSCFLECSGNDNCSTIGFDVDPGVASNGDCKLFKTNGVGKEKKNLKRMFLLINVDDLKKETDEHEEKEEKVMMKRINIITEEQEINRNTLVTTLEKLTQQYVVYAEFKPTVFGRQTWSNILHFTQGGNFEKSGDRTPSIYGQYENENEGKFLISTTNVNGNQRNKVTDNSYPVNTWMAVKVSQLKQKEGHNFSITVNHELIHSVINDQPGLFRNVKVFVADDFATRHQAGFMRKLWVDIECT